MNDDDIPSDDFPDFGGFEGFRDIGKMGLTVYRGVKSDGGSENEAFNVTAAFFAGMNKAAQSDEDDDNGS